MIIGLVGFKRTGKSTVAKYLEEKYGFVRLNMKDALIDEIKQNFPDLLEAIQAAYPTGGVPRLGIQWMPTVDTLFEEKPPLMRALMVNYGTEVRRREDPDYWVLQWKLKAADLMLAGHRNIVVDDIRFLNEMQAITGWQGKTIRIVRDDITTGGNHESETQLIGVETDYTINSKQGDLEGLYKAVDDIMTK